MSTPAAIGMKMGDNTVHAIRVNWDGYLSGVGITLLRNYTNYDLVKGLLNLGEISSLGDTAESCDAYHRDHGEKLAPPDVFNNVDEFFYRGKGRMSADYLYYFDPDTEKWYAAGMHGIRYVDGWNELNEALTEE